MRTRGGGEWGVRERRVLDCGSYCRNVFQAGTERRGKHGCRAFSVFQGSCMIMSLFVFCSDCLPEDGLLGGALAVEGLALLGRVRGRRMGVVGVV